MKDRFDLESEIQSAWSTLEDINHIAEYIVDHPDFEGLPAEFCDKIGNLLFGLHSVAGVRFTRLWDTFEKCVSNGTCTTKSKSNSISDDYLYNSAGERFRFDPDHNNIASNYKRGTLWKIDETDY